MYCGKPLVKQSVNAFKDWNNRKIHKFYWKLQNNKAILDFKQQLMSQYTKTPEQINKIFFSYR